jgi:hypothetical protein
MTAQNASKFEETLGKILDQPNTLKGLLLPLLPTSIVAKSSVFSVGSTVQESIVRFLIEIPKLQTRLLVLLLEKLPEYEYRENEAMEENIPKLILSQLRWLPWIEDSNALAEAFLSALSLASSASLKRDIITWIPETADDSAVDTLVPAMLNLMENEPDLLAACLDTISNLRLSDEHIATVQQSATELLDSVEPENVPVLIKFLFHVVKTDSLPRLFKDLRKKLKIETLPSKSSGKSSSDPQSGAGAAASHAIAGNNCPTMLVECLKASIRARFDLVTAFLSDFTNFSPKDDRGGVQHSLLDLWMVYLIHANLKNLQPKVELLLRKKLLSGAIKGALLGKSISVHPVALRDLYPTISELCKMILQHVHQEVTGASLTKAAVNLHSVLFIHSDPLTRQNLLGQLMRHISSPSSKEADCALLIFDVLVSKYASLVQPFATYIQGLIDFMDGSRLDNSQLVKVYFIFSKIAYPNGPLSFDPDRESKAAEFLTMLILKQTSNPETRYRRMGALGCVAVICVLGAPVTIEAGNNGKEGRNNENIDSLTEAQNAAIAASTIRVCEIISNAFDSNTPEALELFLDELSCSLTQRAAERPLRPEILEQIMHLTSAFIGSWALTRNTLIERGKEKGYLKPLDLLDPDTSQSKNTNGSQTAFSRLPSNIWCDVIPLWPKTDPNWISGDVESGALGMDLYFDDGSSTASSAHSSSKIVIASAMLRLLFTSFEAGNRLESIQLVQFACLNLFPRPETATPALFHAYLNAQKPKALESMASQLIHAINILREFLNIVTRVSPSQSPDDMDMDVYISVRISQTVQLEAYLDMVLDHLPEFPTQLHGSAANLPLVHSADILRDAPTTGPKGGTRAKKTGSSSSGRGRKPKFTPAEKDSEMDAENQMDVDEEADEDHDENEETGDAAPESTNNTSKNSTGQQAAAASAAPTKIWGHTGAFDIKKYRKNLLRVLPRLRPLQPHAVNALYKMDEAYTDNQMRWLLLSDFTEKTAALVPKKLSLNPAKQKPDPAWLRAYSHPIDCLFQMIPAFTALPRQLLLLTSPQTDSEVKALETNGLAGFGALPLCSHLQAPCVRLTLGLLKNMISNPSCYSTYDISETKKSFVAQDVAEKLLQVFVPEGDSQGLACTSWTEFAQACFARLSKYEHVLTDFETAVALVEVLNALAASITEDAGSSRALQAEASAIAMRFLNRYWTSEGVEATETNSIFRNGAKNMPLEGLETLIVAVLGSGVLSSEVVHPLVQGLASLVSEMDQGRAKVREEREAGEGEEEARIRTLTSATLGTFFKVILSRTTQALASYSLVDHEEEDGENDMNVTKLNDMMIGLKTCAFLLKKAMPSETDRVMLGVALRQGKQLVEAFQSKCEWVFAQVELYPIEVQHLMKTYQHATRSLQQNCTLVKDRQYRQLGSLVAPLKKSIETVVSKVRLLSDKHDFGDLVDVKIWNQPSSSAAAERAKPSRPDSDAQDRAKAQSKKRKRDTVPEEPIEEEDAQTEPPTKLPRAE